MLLTKTFDLFIINMCNTCKNATFQTVRRVDWMKRVFTVILSLMVLCAFLTTVSAGQEFEKKNEYTDGIFIDVSGGEWYASEVKSAYELGFMQGVSQTAFSPEGTMTVAEAVTIASRVHASYNGKTIPEVQSEQWYQSYVDYAVAEGIITSEQFDNYDRNIKRYEMAEVFYKSMPESYFTPINNVDYLPDVNEKADYRETILALYNSGIVMGNDEYGMFYPNNDITRCEAAAIINRVAVPENRLQKTLEKRPDPVPALYFIDDTGSMNPSNYGQYGWELDSRGMPAGSTPSQTQVLDTSESERTAMLRTFAEQTSGKIVMETNISFQSADNGFYIILGKDEETQAMCFVTKNGTFHANENGNLTDTGVAVGDYMTVKTITDMDNKTNTLIIDGNFAGTYSFADPACTSVNTLMFSSDKESLVVATPQKTKLYSGYALNEIFMSSSERDGMPYGWTLDGGATAKIEAVASNAYDSYSARISSEAGQTSTLTASFDPITRKVVFEMKFYMPDYNDGTTFALTSGGNEIVKIYTNGNAFYSGDGTLLRTYNGNVWQTLRIEANTDTGVVTYSVNRKKLATGYFNAASFDGVKITLPAEQATDILIDDLFVFNTFDEQPDYVPEPEPVSSDDSIVGIEVCDIWRNGFQFGWDYTSAFDELYPYLGMYDEGSTEVADWEIKWLLEHGIDFKLVCWYSGTPSNPVKTPRNSYGLAAQLDSKYSEMMKYAIMWENSGNLPSNSEQFRNNIVEYWKEYYLYDKDRYFSIDNKALITIYRTSTLLDIFGSADAVKEELDYLRQVCVDLGYDGAIILTTGSDSVTAASMGFDGVYAYNWGQNAFDPEYQKQKLTDQDNGAVSSGITAVPTVGVGFCNMFLGQGNSRSPLITQEDYEEILTWVKDDLLGNRTGETWQTDMLILSNWNEFGEGHYILPTNRIGFTYLDAIRNVFVGEGEHADLRPDDDTRARYNALYDQSRKRIRRYELYSEDDNINTDELTSTLKFDFTTGNEEQIFRNSHGNASVEYTSNSFKGVSAGADFAIVTTRNLDIEASEADYFRIVYKATAATENVKGQLFFLTDSDKNWDEKKNVNFNIIADGEYHEYIVNMTQCGNWKGTIGLFRIDPIERGECEYEIQVVEFLNAPDSYEIYLNSETVSTATAFKPVYENGALKAAIDPYAAGFYTKLGIFYRWNFDKKQLTLYGANDHYIVFTMGSTTAETDKGSVTLKSAPEIIDGIPEIEIEAMAEALELGLTVDGNKYTLTNCYFSQEDGEAADYTWDFNIEGYLDGFTTACLEATEHSGGVVSFKSLSNGKRHDPVMNSPKISIDPVKYEKVVVRMSYDITGGYAEGTTGITSSIFFINPGGSFNGNDVVTVQTEGLSSNGEFIEIEFDMTQHPNWSGTIGQIRFDPFEAEGTFSIDYIKILYTNPEGIIKVTPKPTEVVLDAGAEVPEGIRYSAENANVNIIDDPEEPGKKVFEIKTTANNRAWAYFNIYMSFVPGATYNISYKLYPLKDYAGNGYTDNTIGGNFIYGSDGTNVENHTTGSIKTANDVGWVEVNAEYTVAENYTPSAKDCFQFWSNPANGVGVSYLVSDIRIEIVE